MIAFTLLALFMIASHGFILGFMCYHLLADQNWREVSSTKDRIGFAWIVLFNLAGAIAWTYASVLQFITI